MSYMTVVQTATGAGATAPWCLGVLSEMPLAAAAPKQIETAHQVQGGVHDSPFAEWNHRP